MFIKVTYNAFFTEHLLMCRTTVTQCKYTGGMELLLKMGALDSFQSASLFILEPQRKCYTDSTVKPLNILKD